MTLRSPRWWILHTRPGVVPLLIVTGLLALFAAPTDALAHGVTAGDKGFIQEVSGILLIPFAYLGAKHMLTGYDHLLFLLGVIFFLYRLKDVGLYVTLFAVGHSVTLLAGVLTGVRVSAYGRGSGARSDEGAIVAEFDGMHGWFWRNRTNAVVTVTLRTKGDYQELKQPN